MIYFGTLTFLMFVSSFQEHFLSTKHILSGKIL